MLSKVLAETVSKVLLDSAQISWDVIGDQKHGYFFRIAAVRWYIKHPFSLQWQLIKGISVKNEENTGTSFSETGPRVYPVPQEEKIKDIW